MPLGSELGLAGLLVLVLHPRTWMSASHPWPLPCLAPGQFSWPEQCLVGEKFWSKADLKWFELKKDGLNAPGHEIGSNLWSVLAQANALPGALRGPPYASWFASLCGLPWHNVAEDHVLSWNMLMQLKMLPAEKSLLGVLGRQWINRRLLRNIY